MQCSKGLCQALQKTSLTTRLKLGPVPALTEAETAVVTLTYGGDKIYPSGRLCHHQPDHSFGKTYSNEWGHATPASQLELERARIIKARAFFNRTRVVLEP